MKRIKPSKSLSALLIAASATSLCAIERPVPADQPKEKPAKALQPPQKPLPMPNAEAVRIAPRPYLGVMGSAVSKETAAQLSLVEGIGVTIQYVAKGTPAAKAGLKKYDIITQIGGKDIGDLNQLREAILKHKANEKVEVKYITGGAAKTAQIQLGSTPQRLPRAQARGDRKNGNGAPELEGMRLPQGAIPQDMLKNLPPEQRKQLEQLLKGNLDKLDFRNLNNLDVDQLQKHFNGFGGMKKMELNFDDLMKEGAKHKSRMKMLDSDGSVTLETEGNKKNIELHNAQGKLLYKGPFNTEEDKLKIPKELRARANKIKPGRMKVRPNLPNLKLPKELQELLEEGLQNPRLKGLKLPNGAQMQKFEFKLGGGGAQMNASSTMTDPATGNRYTLRKNDDGKEVEIKDKQGKLLFNGPYNSSSDHLMVPEEFQPFLQKLGSFKMLEGNLKDGFKLQLAPKK